MQKRNKRAAMKYAKPSYYKPYKKPKGYLPKVRYSNLWYFGEPKNACQIVYEAGEAYRRRFLPNSKNKPTRSNAFPQQLTKYLYFLYLTGSRLSEPLMGSLELQIVNRDDGVYVIVKKVNAKHQDSQGAREVLLQTLPICDEFEKAMWDLITDYGQTTRIEDIFKFKEWGNLNNSRLSRLIKRNFKTTLKDTENKVHTNAGITPHILRHMRAYNVLITHNVPRELAMRWMGWSSERMLYHYAQIRTMLQYEDQIKMLRSNNLITNKYMFRSPASLIS